MSSFQWLGLTLCVFYVCYLYILGWKWYFTDDTFGSLLWWLASPVTVPLGAVLRWIWRRHANH